MSKTIYNKLVRDRIPEIIKSNGQTCICEVLQDGDYLRKLDEKLNEECGEYQESKSIDELADILEVVYAIASARGYSVKELEQTRSGKAARRGGFQKKLLLKEVDG